MPLPLGSSLDLHLSSSLGHVFPTYFETYLHGYMQTVTYGDENGQIRPDQLIEKYLSCHVMSVTSCLSCDDTSHRLHGDLETSLANIVFSQCEDLSDRESGYGGVHTQPHTSTLTLSLTHSLHTSTHTITHTQSPHKHTHTITHTQSPHKHTHTITHTQSPHKHTHTVTHTHTVVLCSST